MVGLLPQLSFAWRIMIPKDAPFFREDSANNIRKLLGMCISVLLLLNKAGDELHLCMLPLGDNTLVIGWMAKSGQLAKSSPYYLSVKFMACHITSAIISQGGHLTPQHIQGGRSWQYTFEFLGRPKRKSEPCDPQ